MTTKNLDIDLKKYKGKGFTGLENLGNMCFLNASMQVLNHTYELNAFLESDKYKRFLKAGTPDATILTEWNDLRTVMWSGNGIVTPRKFVHNVQQIAAMKHRDLFTGYAQNDMPEFLLFFMDCLHNSISRSVNMRINGTKENNVDEMAVECYEMLKKTYSKEYSEIMETFYGIYVSEIISKDSGIRQAMKPECYFMLDLPIMDLYNPTRVAKTLYDCFDFYSQPEILEGDNAWHNEKTGKKEDIKKQISFWNFPTILVISLKRFTPDGMSKISNLVDFPLTDLDLSSYVRGYNAPSYCYDLYGICNHVGGVTGGHYTSYVKNADNQWLHFNDRDVSIVNNVNDIISPMAYCLFYRKKNSTI